MVAQSLAGLTVGVTAHRRSDEQAELLRRRGARVVAGPTVQTVPLGPADVVVPATVRTIAHRPEIVVFTTSLGVRSWVDAAEAAGLAEALAETLGRADLVVTRGPKARGAAATLDLAIGWEAPGSRSSEIAAHLVPLVAGRRVVVQRDGADEPHLADALAAAGGDVVDVPVYRWTLPDDLEPARRLVRLALDGGLDALTFTSTAAVTNLLAIAGGEGPGVVDALRAAAARMLVVAVGEVTAEALAGHGLGSPLAPTRPRLGAMVHLLGDVAGDLPETAVGPVALRIGASAARVGEAVVELAPRERGVLVELARRPGAVVAKAELRRSVWTEGGEVDDHAVEVTVGRLRKRLPPVLEVRTVPKRGYRLVAAPPAPAAGGPAPSTVGLSPG